MANFKPRTQTDLQGGDQRVDCDGLLEVVEQEEVEVVVEAMVTVVVVLAMEVVEVEVEVEVEGVGLERTKRSVAEVGRTPAEEVVGWVEGESLGVPGWSPPGPAQAGGGAGGPGTGWGWGGRQ